MRDEITPEVLTDRVKQFQQVNTVLSTVYRYPTAVAQEMESNLSALQEKYPVNTNVGAFVATLRKILKNRPALKWFNYMEESGFKKFEQLMGAKPELFAPLLNSFERVMEDVTKNQTSEAAQRFVENANETDSPTMSKLRQLVELNSALAHIARINPEVASEIDSVFSELINTTHQENTSFGKALIRMRSLVRNRRVLLWFDFLEKAGAGKLEKLIATKDQWSYLAEN